MAEVFGVVAAAAQLTTTCVSLLEFTRKLKGCSSTLRGYQRQLQELRNLSEAISSNPLLQTPEVGEHTCSILTVVNENDLKPLIQRGRFHRSFSFLSRDRELSEVFNSLERQKTSLSLVIHNLQAQAIHQIQSKVNMGKSEHSDVDSVIEKPVIEKQDHRPTPFVIPPEPRDAQLVKIPTTEHGQALRETMFQNQGNSNFFYGVYGGLPSTSEEEYHKAMRIRKDFIENQGGGDFFYKCNSHYNGRQENGPILSGGKEVGPMMNSLLQAPSDGYFDCNSMGDSIQTNAPSVFHHGDVDIDLSQSKENVRLNCNPIPGPSPGGVASAGRQYNHIQVHRMRDGKGTRRKGKGKGKVEE